MKKILQINICSNVLSTGKIMEDIGRVAMSHGWESFVAYAGDSKHSESHEIKIGSSFDRYEHALEVRLFDNVGLSSRKATRKFVKQIEEIRPDIVQLHNIHGYYLNYPILFDCLKRLGIPVVWTFHDCWAFTGHCFHPVFVPCDKFKTHCDKCPAKKEYPGSLLLDRSYKNFDAKNRIFHSVDLTIVPVSNWLGSVVKESFLSDCKMHVIRNGIDLKTVKYNPNCDSIRDKYGITGGHVYLGVASRWIASKGLDDFRRLNEKLGDDEQIVLVGLSSDQISNLPKGMKGIERTTSIQELVDLYSISDALINPTYADSFPTINLEALACGTPVITYRTGGSPEAVLSAPEPPKGEHGIIYTDCGAIVEKGDIDGIYSAIHTIKEKGRDSYSSACRKRAEQEFDKDKCFEKYVELYDDLLSN